MGYSVFETKKKKPIQNKSPTLGGKREKFVTHTTPVRVFYTCNL